ncbi:LacI family DNA-binding transcriptional regulator [Tessaracoccus antarcticus]|uniref:LacI family transcriptional regulator n=1 Tax=Tessaracoccus antarcticus TaxID=2479848 RepID=A0A3M0G6V9_9ACTN|nr:LacI family DNA-binding transcriptional regulator [Tessaracoccus antarcticus]RMB59847.1 LacI family transcriptional regulator [Tessaracoccus antarcticus]
MNVSRRATLTDVAHEARVSIKTASRVLNGVETVAPHMRARVLAAASLLGYRPHRGAATMRSGTSDMVGMIIRDMSNNFYSSLAAGAADEAQKHGCLVITCSSEGSSEREAQLTEAIFSQRPRGLLITPTSMTAPLICTEVSFGTPVVAIDEPLEGLDVDSVGFDNLLSTREAVTAAVSIGRRDFAILSDSAALRTMAPRVVGAKEALAAKGLRVRPGMTIPDIHTESQARAATARILSLPRPPDAIFCANNVSALGAAAEIHTSGLNVAIVAFDEFPLSHTQNGPVLVIEHDDRAMGAMAAQLLFDRLADPGRATRHIVVETALRIH